MSMTAVPISILLVLAPIAARSGNGDPSWRAKWWTRTYAPSAPSCSAAWASSIDWMRASAPDRTCEYGASDQCPNDRNPIFFMGTILGRRGGRGRSGVAVTRRARVGRRPRHRDADPDVEAAAAEVHAEAVAAGAGHAVALHRPGHIARMDLALRQDAPGWRRRLDHVLPVRKGAARERQALSGRRDAG